MAEPINLNKARKRRARAAKEQRAAENRIKFGRTKAQKRADNADRERAEKGLSQREIKRSDDSNE